MKAGGKSQVQIDTLLATPDLADALDNEQFRLFLDQVPIAIVVGEMQAVERIVYANPEFERLSGQPLAEILGKHWAAIRGESKGADAVRNLGGAPVPARSIAGLRVFLLEDDPTILFALDAVVESFGCVVVGTAMRVADGFAFLAENDFDAAILDVRLADGDSDPLVAALVARGIPVTITSGARAEGHERVSEGTQFLQKPYRDRDLHKALLEMRRTSDRS